MAQHWNFYTELGLDRNKAGDELERDIQGKVENLKQQGVAESDGQVQQLLVARTILGSNQLRRRYDERLNDDTAPAMDAGALSYFARHGSFLDEAGNFQLHDTRDNAAPSATTPQASGVQGSGSQGSGSAGSNGPASSSAQTSQQRPYAQAVTTTKQYVPAPAADAELSLPQRLKTAPMLVKVLAWLLAGLAFAQTLLALFALILLWNSPGETLQSLVGTAISMVVVPMLACLLTFQAYLNTSWCVRVIKGHDRDYFFPFLALYSLFSALSVTMFIFYGVGFDDGLIAFVTFVFMAAHIAVAIIGVLPDTRQWFKGNTTVVSRSTQPYQQ